MRRAPIAGATLAALVFVVGTVATVGPTPDVMLAVLIAILGGAMLERR